jgi:hypothetical protein
MNSPASPIPVRAAPSNAGRPEAAATIWRWREESARRGARDRAIRNRLILSGLFGLLASLVVAWLDHPVAGWVVRTVALVTLAIGGFATPPGRAAVDRAIAGLGTVAGVVVAHLVLTPFFYLVITPVGLARRLLGTDALRRRREPSRPSYWEPRTRPSSPHRPF